MTINMSGVAAKRAPLAFLIVGLTLVGCESLRVYDGPRRSDSELAHIAGDSRVAGAPLSVILRQVDGADLGVRYSSVRVLPGAHSLLIDCTVTESKHTSRHHLDVDVDADVKYRLVARTGSGNRECADVQLVQVN
jgi:hypothetical protein